MRTIRRGASLAPEQPAARAAAPPEAAAQRQLWFVRRVDYLVLVSALLLTAAFWVVFFVFDVDLDKLNTYGYIGLFVISLVSAASIVLPMPGAAAITGAGALLHPVLGIPVPLLVGLVAGLAEALGELTGYAAGHAGSALFQEQRVYPRIKRWMDRRGVLTLFLLSCFPNPLLDVAGVIAGATRTGIAQFFATVLPGKFVKNVYLSAGGLALGEIIRRIV